MAFKILTMEFMILIFFINSTSLESSRVMYTQDSVDTKQSALSAFCLFLVTMLESSSRWLPCAWRLKCGNRQTEHRERFSAGSP